MNCKISQITEASSRVATFIDKEDRLPNNVSLNMNYISMSEFLYLMTSAVVNIGSGQLNDVPFREVADAPAPAANYTAGKQIEKVEYLKVANNIKKFIEIYNRAPNGANTPIGQLATNDLVYDYSKILAFYNAGGVGRLPNYITVNPITNSNPVTGGEIYDMFVDQTGRTFDTITEFYNSTIIPDAVYSNPMYFDDLKTPVQSMQAIINNVHGVYTGQANQNNCCDFAQLIALLGKEKGYGEYGKDIVLRGFRCPSYECYHAVAQFSKKEFAGYTFQTRDYQYGPILVMNGAIVDGAAGASDRYPIMKYWCEATNQLAYKEPNWLPYEYD